MGGLFLFFLELFLFIMALGAIPYAIIRIIHYFTGQSGKKDSEKATFPEQIDSVTMKPEISAPNSFKSKATTTQGKMTMNNNKETFTDYFFGRTKQQRQSSVRLNAFFFIMIPVGALVLMYAWGEWSWGSKARSAIVGIIAIAMIAVGAYKSFTQNQRINKYNTYVSRSGNTSLLKLAKEVGVGINQVEMEIQKMIDADFFPPCYIDHEKHLLVMTKNGAPIKEPRSSEVIECPYCGAEIAKGSKFCNICGKSLEESDDPHENTIADQERDKEILQLREEYIQTISTCAEKTDDKDLHDRLMLLKGISENVFLRVSTRPEYLSGVRRYKNIYLPKLENAIDISVAMIAGGASEENVKKAKDNAFQVVNIGLKSTQKFLDSMYEGDQLDVETDLEVLKQLFL